MIGPRRDGGRPLPHRTPGDAAAQRAARRGRDASDDGAILGGDPQDLKYPGRGDLGRDRATAPSSASTPRSTAAPSATVKTVVGARCFIMTYVHLAHDCHVGDDVVIANATQLRRPRHDPRPGDPQRAQRHPPVRHDRHLRLRRRRVPGQPGHPAVREGSRQSDGAVRAQLDRPPARRLLGRDRGGAQARLPALLQFRSEPVAGTGAGPHRSTRRSPRWSASSTFVESSRARRTGVSARASDRRDRGRRAGPAPRPAPRRASTAFAWSACTTSTGAAPTRSRRSCGTRAFADLDAAARPGGGGHRRGADSGPRRGRTPRAGARHPGADGEAAGRRRWPRRTR